MEFAKMPIKSVFNKTGKLAIDIDAVDLPKDFETKERWVIQFGGLTYGGCHTHERIECFVGFGEGLIFVWKDEQGKLHQESMNPEGELYMFKVEAGLPHAVVNLSTAPATMLEYADGPLVAEMDAEIEKFIKNLISNYE